MEKIRLLAEKSAITLTRSDFKLEQQDATWNYDDVEEFFGDYRTSTGFAWFTVYGGGYDIDVTHRLNQAEVSVKAPTKSEIEAVFDIFERNLDQSRLSVQPESVKEAPVVFIGHGRSAAWRDLKDHLQDKHGIQIEAYETGARAGHTIRDILEEMIERSSFAVLVMTAEDEQGDGGMRARQNVIHEAGLFQGRLGFAKAILLLEHGVEEFSNVQGIQYIPFAKNNIRETFGDVVATLWREFPEQKR
jgi:predicted nucleotide-binding protein